jgi:hypothetical protein
MVVRSKLEERVKEKQYDDALSEVLRHPKVSTKLRTAKDFGFEGDNYYTAEEKMQMRNREGGLVSGPFSRHLPAT